MKKPHLLKGINLGGWLSQCSYDKEHLDNFIKDEDFSIISSWDMDHVRIPFDYNIVQDANGNFIEEGFQRIADAVANCRKCGLDVVLDLHKTAGFSFDYYGESESGFFDSEEYQERFYSLWEKTAELFGKYSDTIAFELLNEITDENFITPWNRISKECIKRIREYAPDTIILVGSYKNNAADTVQYLDAPADSNVIYNMHCYEPLKFTHQGAYWTTAINPSERIKYADSGCSEEYFENLFSTAIAKAEKHNTRLYCGEYGVINVVSPEETLRWYKDINAVFKKHNIGRCAWTYKNMDFGISDSRLDIIRNGLIKYL
ncbi:MAG: cellulase family glycosylhydrolase [Ruminococcus sp.]|nr:cellulase family glycosylhydrolase [Ruminococcus sp.]